MKDKRERERRKEAKEERKVKRKLFFIRLLGYRGRRGKVEEEGEEET